MDSIIAFGTAVIAAFILGLIGIWLYIGWQLVKLYLTTHTRRSRRWPGSTQEPD